MERTRRKELTRAYKMALPPMGIFSIKNLVTGRTLVDQSINLAGALNRHRMELQLGTHRNKALMEDWRTYGDEHFAFEVLQQIQERAEPDYNYAEEMAQHLAIWRAKIPLGSAGSYL
ncbi:GIY-YIG nuclease family protein [Dyella subtropica]|uniref:GIY-YIG nuclease family protein n=1 Tax=Dyella subtropica TaxID=2992127 RepID=UPI00225B0FA8|nr:GIY-YIG nuclease family protein [Dyella subtropica]